MARCTNLLLFMISHTPEPVRLRVPGDSAKVVDSQQKLHIITNNTKRIVYI